MNVYVARQPIFNRSENVIAYELLYRDSEKNFFNATIESNIATAILLMNSYFHFGIDTLVGNHTAFINFDKSLINADIPQLLSTNKVVIEILENIQQDTEIIKKLIQLRKDGYTLAIDDFMIDYPHHEIVNITQIIKVDFLSNTQNDIIKICNTYRKQGKLLLAEKVETREMYDWAKKLGFDYFQGYFFAKPLMIKSKGLASSSAQFIRLLKAVNEPEPDFKIISQIIEVDVFLTYKLLRVVNSSFSLGTEIASIHHALSILGITTFSRWLTLASLQSLGNINDGELVKTAMVRSKFLESMGQNSSLLMGHEDELSLLGLLSVIDVLLQEPMVDIVKNLPLSANVKNAFLGHESLYLYPYKLCLSYERGEFDTVEDYANKLQYQLPNLSHDYFAAILWAEELYKYMNDNSSNETF